MKIYGERHYGGEIGSYKDKDKEKDKGMYKDMGMDKRRG